MVMCLLPVFLGVLCSPNSAACLITKDGASNRYVINASFCWHFMLVIFTDLVVIVTFQLVHH